MHLKFNETMLLKSRRFKEIRIRKRLENNIVLLKLFPGITEKTIKSILEIEGLKGVILETFGSGNAPTDKWFVKLLKDTLKKGIKIVDVTQCVEGSVILGHYQTSEHLQKMGLISGKDITTESALAKMMYLLGQKIADSEFKEVFETPLRGEMTE